MMGGMTNTRATIKGEHSILPGSYAATWSGWKVKLGNQSYEVTQGIRGTSPATLTVDAQGIATVEVYDGRKTPAGWRP
jgi:hypothetical protein